MRVGPHPKELVVPSPTTRPVPAAALLSVSDISDTVSTRMDIRTTIPGAKMSKRVSTGHPAPASGQYRPTGGGPEVTMIRGRVAPPSGGKAVTYSLVDPSKNKSGR